MSDRMQTLPFATLLDWILTEYRASDAIFGVPSRLFYRPDPDAPLVSTLFGERLNTPIGPAAGPHTQLTQNILAAWLTGGRFIELKTVQVMDDLEIPRPCIDMADEGYNVEWSQELALEESVTEYIKAWVLVRVLRRLLGHEDVPFGTIFNMSVGYNLEGILSPPMQRFMSRLENAKEDLEPIRATLKEGYPTFADLEIPDEITSSVTLSTMHGCPPDEIERIATYLMEERGLHTTVKLNPTLLGKDIVLGILHDELGFTEIEIPDRVFEHDLGYDRAVELVRSLQATAAARGLEFSVKLSNTLAMSNHRGELPGDEMYMSGRALFPLTVQLFRVLQDEFSGGLRVSYSAGADAWNTSELLAAGARPITTASDLLKPGGYGRFAQVLEEIENAMASGGCESLEALASEARDRLPELAAAARTDRRYKKRYAAEFLPKVSSELTPFDCIEAPCVAACAVCQDVPEYCDLIARGEIDRALSVILDRNPLPGTTGHVCTNLCQTRCTRNNTDESVSIRRLKRFATEHGIAAVSVAPDTGKTTAIIGGGPSGLAAAYHLAQCGIGVTIFETRGRAGGMLAIAPRFRLPRDVVDADIRRITDLGVRIETNQRIDAPPSALLDRGFDAVYVACGFADDRRPAIPGDDATGVFGALEFLERVSMGTPPELGDHVVVIGGGNTAMDAARTAQRLTGSPSTVLYRRTRREMPAEEEEIHDLILEGNDLRELSIPIRIESDGSRVTEIVCQKTTLGKPDATGRRRPVPVEGSEFRLPATSVIFAVGQTADTAFLGATITRRSDGSLVVDEATGQVDGAVFAGGDVARGPEIIITACADGRRAAQGICDVLGVPFVERQSLPDVPTSDVAVLKTNRARRVAPEAPDMLPAERRSGFDRVESTLSADAAAAEASRCLQCRTLCDKCVEVCPNRANIPITVPPYEATLPVYRVQGGEVSAVETEQVAIHQPRQIIHVDDLCNECGNCATFCVHEGRPYSDKPRLFLSREAFEREDGNAYYIEDRTLYSRRPAGDARLTLHDTDMLYEDAHVRVHFDHALEQWQVESLAETEERVSLRHAVEMATLAKGVTGSAPWLLAAKIKGGSA